VAGVELDPGTLHGQLVFAVCTLTCYVVRADVGAALATV
jgi:hypothetical protein